MTNIKNLREQINKLDRELLGKINERFLIVREIGLLKKEADQDIFDEDRESELLDLYNNWAEELELDQEFIKKIFELILSQSKKEQSDL